MNAQQPSVPQPEKTQQQQAQGSFGLPSALSSSHKLPINPAQTNDEVGKIAQLGYN